MESNKFRSMSTDELWDLYVEVHSALADKVEAERAKLNERLRRIESISTVGMNRVRRQYPRVRPKYMNPSNPEEVWSGRGKQPLWVKEQLNTGKKLDQFSDCRVAQFSDKLILLRHRFR